MIENDYVGALPTIYLAGKVRGKKWELVKGFEDTAIFLASDGAAHGEHLWGTWEHRFGEHKSDVNSACIEPLTQCDLLIAYLDQADSFGSIAEIAYASALGKPCYVIILDPDYEQAGAGNQPKFFDSYWFITSFPNVATAVVSSEEEAHFIALRIVHAASVEILLNDFKRTLESPMEEKFALALINRANYIAWGSGGGPVIKAQFGTATAYVHPQYVVKLAKTYRLDFYIQGEGVTLAVEIDGHEFHERTKEQAQRDKERDRALAAAGFTVLRFTGSEIYRNADGAASEVASFIERASA